LNSEVIPGRPLARGELERLAAARPLLHRLLTEPGLTTPLWERELGHPLLARQTIDRVPEGWSRLNRLFSPLHGLVEIARVQLPEACESWAHCRDPLGPWLARAGFGLQKRDLELRALAPDEVRTHLHDALPAGSPIAYGRAYILAVTSGDATTISLPILEVFLPPGGR
jgi:hypothetical protein